MTTEDDFNAMLDAHPEDAATRLVFADWLDERGDPRGPGYRALGALRRFSCSAYANKTYVPSEETHWWRDDGEEHELPETELPPDWFDLIESDWKGLRSCRHDSRREAEDAAALAFARLPAERRAELLAGAAVAPAVPAAG